MSIWKRIALALKALSQGESLSTVFEKLKSPPERSVAFTIAVISLGAKMAKADGQVTRDEVKAFRKIFHIDRQDEANAAKVFNLARQDVAGYTVYAGRIQRMFGHRNQILYDLLEGLFAIAVADGVYHDNEDEFLRNVATIFGITKNEFIRIRDRFKPFESMDPYLILGVSRDTPLEKIKEVYRNSVRETHPDIMMARGIPMEAHKLAEQKLKDLNNAWEEIQRIH
ncbi:MAG: TerB family tellurite resistance protein [Roseovarius sp.]|nr:TerB family tellurite resistance protein [Roseovarius sp.]MCY4209308.1 TerB family tellurite resistance protein [Roseovarius sp.]MCY4292695.1 TerB family tellurite resistance protein [Roseovarius sp.]MCY4316616.1 TerB family tellurite resistance protein [Roseovarius sp.]